MKVAIYSRGRKLAVREQPVADAPVVGTLADGTAVLVEDAGAAGWLECRTGFIRSDFVTIGELQEVPAVKHEGEQGEEPVQSLEPAEETERPEWPSDDEQAVQSPEEQAEETESEQPPADEEDGSALMAMKINELRELAKGSGIALPRNATKAQIIEILTGINE